MSAKTKQWAGRIKQAVGSLTGRKRLEREGAADRRSGQAEERIARAKGKVDETIDKAAGVVKGVLRTGKDK
jgi:uncharacterized protein YjbJ (UPF0337 family)